MEVETRLELSSAKVLDDLKNYLGTPGFFMDGYLIEKRGETCIRDVYLDTSRRHFGARGRAMRIRTRDGQLVVSFKEDLKLDSSWAIREDIELPPGIRAREKAASWLAEVNLAECVPHEGETRQFNQIFGQEIAKWLHVLVEIVTNRTTYRIAAGNEGCLLALDAVFYPESGQRSFLVEIEALGNQSTDHVRKVRDWLLQMLGSSARPDVGSKVKRGIRFRELAQRGN